jgi:hypothetical protein
VAVRDGAGVAVIDGVGSGVAACVGPGVPAGGATVAVGAGATGASVAAGAAGSGVASSSDPGAVPSGDDVAAGVDVGSGVPIGSGLSVGAPRASRTPSGCASPPASRSFSVAEPISSAAPTRTAVPRSPTAATPAPARATRTSGLGRGAGPPWSGGIGARSSSTPVSASRPAARCETVAAARSVERQVARRIPRRRAGDPGLESLVWIVHAIVRAATARMRRTSGPSVATGATGVVTYADR